LRGNFSLSSWSPGDALTALNPKTRTPGNDGVFDNIRKFREKVKRSRESTLAADYFRKREKMIVRRILRMMQVAIGKYKVNFSFLMIMSPGSFPIQGILSPMTRRTPIPAMIAPETINTFPRPLNPTMKYLVFYFKF